MENLPSNTENGRVGNLINSLGIPQRVILGIFGFLAIINASTLRLCLDATLEHIVNSNPNLKLENTYFWGGTRSGLGTADLNDFKTENKAHLSPWSELGNIYIERSSTSWSEVKSSLRQKCHRTRRSSRPMEAGILLNWSKHKQAVVVVSFYVGYVMSQIPGSILAQKYGGKRVLALSLTFAAVLTLLTPFIIKHGGVGSLIVLRILLGLCEGPALPALSSLLAKWVPPHERGKLCSFALSGGQIGVVLVNMVSTLVFHLMQWPIIFYFFGACALIWALGFVLFCSDEPAFDPYIKPNECVYLQESIGNIEPSAQLLPIPWREIFINVPVWAIISSVLQYDWAQAEGTKLLPPVDLILTEQTLTDELYENFKASMPNIINWGVSVITGSICDTLVEHEMLSTTDVRKIMATITALGPRFINDLNSCLTCPEHINFISKMNCAVGVLGTFYAGAKLTPFDLSPNYAGILMAFSKGVTSLSAILIPQLEELYPNTVS